MAKAFDLRLLHRRWVHSHEEDGADGRVYRPASFAFPRSRGRESMELRADGTLVETGPASDDRRRTATGTWSLEGAPAASLRLRTEGAAERRLTVIELEDDRLVVRP